MSTGRITFESSPQVPSSIRLRAPIARTRNPRTSDGRARRQRERGRIGIVLGRDEEPGAEVQHEARAAEQGQDHEPDPEEHRIDAEILAEPAGDTGHLALGPATQPPMGRWRALRHRPPERAPGVVDVGGRRVARGRVRARGPGGGPWSGAGPGSGAAPPVGDCPADGGCSAGGGAAPRPGCPGRIRDAGGCLRTRFMFPVSVLLAAPTMRDKPDRAVRHSGLSQG